MPVTQFTAPREGFITHRDPSAPGTYEVAIEGRDGPRYSRWDGRQWYAFNRDIAVAQDMDTRSHSIYGANWRGWREISGAVPAAEAVPAPLQLRDGGRYRTRGGRVLTARRVHETDGQYVADAIRRWRAEGAPEPYFELDGDGWRTVDGVYWHQRQNHTYRGHIVEEVEEPPPAAPAASPAFIPGRTYRSRSGLFTARYLGTCRGSRFGDRNRTAEFEVVSGERPGYAADDGRVHVRPNGRWTDGHDDQVDMTFELAEPEAVPVATPDDPMPGVGADGDPDPTAKLVEFMQWVDRNGWDFDGLLVDARKRMDAEPEPAPAVQTDDVSEREVAHADA